MVLYVFLLPLLFITNTSAKEEKCEGNQYRYGECQCLEFVINPQVYWDEAAAKCTAKGSHLVTILEQEKQDFITDTLNEISDRNGVWIGMKRDNKGVLRWIDNGTAVSQGFQIWANGEPDPADTFYTQDCGMMHVGDGWKWKDYFCGTERYSYICQYETCSSEVKDGGWDTNVVIGVVVGSVIGLICFFAVVFFLINCCRDAVRRKRHNTPTVELREVETGSRYEDEMHTSVPMIPPPEKASSSQITNDLDRSSLKKKKAPLITANVEVSASADYPPTTGLPSVRDSIKISNLSQTNNQPSRQNDRKRRDSDGSEEDNYLAANTDTDDHKNYSSSVHGVDKL